MIAKIKRLAVPVITRLKDFFGNHWKDYGYTCFPDHPHYFEAFTRYENIPHPRRFENNWERLI